MGEARPITRFGNHAVFAHSLSGHPQASWETLDCHAAAVAALARAFADAFGAGDWGELAGLWHDLGKIQAAFQEYIRGERASGPPHAWVGAVFALSRGRALLPLAAAIAAHHGGLLDVTPDEAQGMAAGATLSDLVRSRLPELRRLEPMIPAAWTTRPLPSLPPSAMSSGADLRRIELFTRMLFSALVDADRLATARFYSRFSGDLTADDLRYDSIAALSERLDAAIDAMPPKGSAAVIELRRQVLRACREAAAQPPGRFSLTVPTGGGKTLSAMSFALRHARQHGLRRVIVVMPYTSIIEQSARVYREILGDQNVLEHHSNLDEQKLTEQDARREDLRKLAAENWDSPVIATTTVQFFHSLLAAHSSRCRKVHNIARSVVILDEVQTLPPQFLRTVLEVLGQLTDGYGCSIVLTTATPPALAHNPQTSRAGLKGVREIMPDPSLLAAGVRRVRVEWRVDRAVSYAELAGELSAHHQALAIVHRRDDARVLTELTGKSALHLSALMCPAHRIKVLQEVHRRLRASEPCLLVATQLIEAGVDVDFPVVYRALAGLDSIAQAAGRCDREGKLTAAAGMPGGRMIVFRAETDPPPGMPKKAFETMDILLKRGGIDPFEPRDAIRFFDELYGKIDDDQHNVESLRKALAFAAVEERFKIIDADMHPIVVPWGEGAARIEAYRRAPSRQTRRALQPFTVQVRRYPTLERLREAGVCAPVDDLGLFDVISEGRKAYCDRYGLDDRGAGLAAEESVV